MDRGVHGKVKENLITAENVSWAKFQGLPSTAPCIRKRRSRSERGEALAGFWPQLQMVTLQATASWKKPLLQVSKKKSISN